MFQFAASFNKNILEWDTRKVVTSREHIQKRNGLVQEVFLSERFERAERVLVHGVRKAGGVFR